MTRLLIPAFTEEGLLDQRNHTSFHVHADISDVFVDIGDLHAVYHKRSWLNEDCFSRSQNFRGVFAKLCGQVD